LLAVFASAVLLSGLTPIRPAGPVAATTAQTMAADLLSWINTARAKHGLGKLRTSSTLYSLASKRAATLASKNALSHDAAGCLTCQLRSLGVSYNLMGEVLASNNYTWGTQSASVVFSSWRNSPMHWDILMGSRFDTIGIGIARSKNGTTYASAILIDAPGVSAIRTTATHTVTRKPAQAAVPATPPAPRRVRREGSVLFGRIPC
jgi:uncharacterized protein YkwD